MRKRRKGEVRRRENKICATVGAEVSQLIEELATSGGAQKIIPGNYGFDYS